MKQLSQYYDKFRTIISKIPLKYIYFILLLAILLLTVWTRVQPLYLPLADVQAERNVMYFYEQQIASSIAQQYPNLPDSNKQVLVDNELATFVSENQLELEEQVGLLAEEIRSIYQHEAGQTYLLGIDPYHYYRQTYYDLEYGMPGDSMVDGIVYDSYRLAPLGVETSDTFHSKFSSLWHNLLNVFGNFDLMYTFFMVGVFFVTMTILFFYLHLSSELRPLPALIASLIFATSLFFVSRTTGESSDTDIYVLFFPVLCLFLYRYKSSRLVSFFTSSLTGLTLGLYSFAWGAWWYFMSIFIFSISLDLIINYFQKNDVVLKLHRFLILLVSSFLSVSFLSGYKTYFSFLTSPFNSIFNFKGVAIGSLWPNIYTTVAELNSVSMGNVVTQLGGNIVVLFSLIGTLYCLYLSYKNQDYLLGLFLLFWWLASIYATTQGVRFILLIILSFSFGIAYFVKLIFELSTFLYKQLNIPVIISKLTFLFIFCVVLSTSVMSGVLASQSTAPSLDDVVYESLEYIKLNSDDTAIITSWWDFGYWFRAIADRPVTFDGGTQVGYNAYWVGKLLSTNEETATGISRMLNCGQNLAFEELYPSLNNHQETINLLEEVVVLPKEEAQLFLEGLGLPIDVLDYTHCQAPTGLLITSGDMVAKAGVWGHFGAWNFTKALMYQDVNSLSASDALKLLSDDHGLNQTASINEYNLMQSGADAYIAGYPGFITSFDCVGDNILNCDVVYNSFKSTLIYDKTTFELNYSGDLGIELFKVSNLTFPGSTSNNIGLYIDPILNKGYVSSLELLGGTFGNLFYLEDSDCYDLFYKGNSQTIGKFLVWQTDYSCLE